MKKIITLLLALLMMISLVACSADDGSFKRGVITDNVYTNKITGVTYTAPEGYTYYSDEMVAARYNTTVDILYPKKLDTIIYDMYCGNGEIGSSLNIIYENIANVYGTVFDENAYLTFCLASIKTSFESTEGVRITNIAEETIEINGTEYLSANISLRVNGEEFYETVIVKDFDGYMMRLTAAAYDEAELESILAGLEVAA